MLKCKVGAIWTFRGPVCVAKTAPNMYWHYQTEPYHINYDVDSRWNTDGISGAACNNAGHYVHY